MILEIAVCDDNLTTLDIIEEIMQRVFCAKGHIPLISKFHRSVDMIDLIKKNKKFDVFFIDINMPGIDGIKMGTILWQEVKRNYEKTPALVYISNREDRVFETFKNSPLRFVRKSYLKSELPEAVDAVIEFILKRKDDSRLSIETNQGIVSFPLDGIVYIESANKKQRIVTAAHTYESELTMRSLEEQMNVKGFIRTHRCYMVNYRHIAVIEKEMVLLANGKRVPIGRGRRTDIMDKFQRFLA